jgi:glucose/arabinose dehydrogenase
MPLKKVLCAFGAMAALGIAQQQPHQLPPQQQQVGESGFRRTGYQATPLGSGLFIFDTAERFSFKVSVIARGMPHPWSLVFLPNGDMLVTERGGRIRLIHDGVLNPNPVSGVPQVLAAGNAGLFDLALDPKFNENKLLYLTYAKPTELDDPSGLTIHPDTGVIYEVEHGPNGGDELNLLLPGRNYGWPLVSYGRHYTGERVSASPTGEGIEDPIVIWNPSIATSGLVFYSGDKFPGWKGNAFVGRMQRGEITNTGRIERIVFNAKMQEMRRESLLTELHQRIRDVRQGPDGYLYLLTEETYGALLRIEPEP